MKKVLTKCFLGAILLSSCGGPSPAKDIEGTVKIMEDLHSVQEEEFKDKLEFTKKALELAKEWEETTKESHLKEYGGIKEGYKNLEKKVKANDEKAIEDWIAFETAYNEYQKEVEDLEYEYRISNWKKIEELKWAKKSSIELLDLIHNGDKKKDFKEDKKKLEGELKIAKDKLEELEDEYYNEFKKWHDTEFCKKDCKKTWKYEMDNYEESPKARQIEAYHDNPFTQKPKKSEKEKSKK